MQKGRAKRKPNKKLQGGTQSKNVGNGCKWATIILFVALCLGFFSTTFGKEQAINLHQKVNQTFSNWTLPVIDQVKDQWDETIIRGLLEIQRQLTPEKSSHRPGQEAAARGMKMKHPVVIVPGFISSQLELWQGKPCASKFLMTSIWGSLNMIQFLLFDVICWFEHLTLDHKSGMDIEGIKLRPAESFHGIDFLFPGFWLFGKIFENLADIGYDSSTIYCATYDWRMAPQLLEKRDHYMSKLKFQIELLVRLHGEKVVVLTHSMGSGYWYYFMKWAENQDSQWVDQNIHAFVNIGGAMLGTAKGLSSLISGEMKDSVEFQTGRAYVADTLVSPLARLSMLRSWTSIAALLPKGGDDVWGPDGENVMLFFEDHNRTATESYQFLRDRLEIGEAGELVSKSLQEGKLLLDNIDKFYDMSVNRKPLPFENTPRKWSSPLTSRLPNARNLKIYCLYGVGKPTERGFYYQDSQLPSFEGVPLPGIRYSVDTTKGSSGVLLGEGDGTVPLVSLGHVCVSSWKDPYYNPGNTSSVWTREYDHNPSTILRDIRGGATTADHVDILGNTALLTDILAIVSGSTSVDEDAILSNIREYSKKIDKNIHKERA